MPIGNLEGSISHGSQSIPSFLITTTARKDVFIHFIISSYGFVPVIGRWYYKHSRRSSTGPNTLTLLGLGSEDPAGSKTLAWPDVWPTTPIPASLTVH